MKCAVAIAAALLLATSALPARKYWLQQVSAREGALENPYDSDASAEAAGAKLYRRYCASCHGENAEGDRGPSLRSPTVQNASPGALFWLLRNGILDRGMPAWSKLPEQQRWQIVTYLRTLPGSPTQPHVRK